MDEGIRFSCARMFSDLYKKKIKDDLNVVGLVRQRSVKI